MSRLKVLSVILGSAAVIAALGACGPAATDAQTASTTTTIVEESSSSTGHSVVATAGTGDGEATRGSPSVTRGDQQLESSWFPSESAFPGFEYETVGVVSGNTVSADDGVQLIKIDVSGAECVGSKGSVLVPAAVGGAAFERESAGQEPKEVTSVMILEMANAEEASQVLDNHRKVQKAVADSGTCDLPDATPFSAGSEVVGRATCPPADECESSTYAVDASQFTGTEARMTLFRRGKFVIFYDAIIKPSRGPDDVMDLVLSNIPG